MKYITLNNNTTESLQAIQKNDTRHKSRIRAQAILLNAQGEKIPNIARMINVTQRTLYRWFNRFEQSNIDTIHELAGRGRKPLFVKFHHVVPFQKQYLETHLVKS